MTFNPQLTKQKLVEIVDTANRWSDVRKHVVDDNELGLGGSRLKSLQRPRELFFLVASIYSANQGVTDRTNNSVLPGTVVDKDGVRYMLNGIRHFWISKQMLSEQLSIAELVFGEPGMSRYYSGSNYVEQPRVDELKYVQHVVRWILKDEGLAHFSRFVLPMLVKLKKVNFTPLQTVKHVQSARRLYMHGSPEDFRLPAHLEADYVRTVAQTESTDRRNLMRSLSMSEFLELKTQEHDVSEAHLFGGLSHEPEMAIFLRNPAIADELRNRYANLHDRFYIPFSALKWFLGTGICSAGAGAGIELLLKSPNEILGIVGAATTAAIGGSVFLAAKGASYISRINTQGM